MLAGSPRLLRATAADLPSAVASALTHPDPGRDLAVGSGGHPWHAIEWGAPADPAVLLVHGVTSSAETFWRIGPAVAAAGRHVLAVDLPGHGRTGHWRGRHRFAETAADVAGFIRAAGLDRPDLAVLGHSWGGMVVAALPAAGLRPGRLILLDPPALPHASLEELTRDPTEQPYRSLDEATSAVRAANPGWSNGDVQAKALALTRFDVPAALAILLDNGDWDGGLAALGDPAAADIPTWMIRGVPEAGCMVPDAVVPAFRTRIGRDQVITIADAPHSPQRTHPEATVLAILRALGLP
ncbi:MAG TPA: alpha/beta fold hydrolase [Candidatus Sulfomarinibacteraceae bacterium]|nr:alpha/beta fold hydrolase [Candidatus Sulfomarinibacteraceae bacterium]